MKAAVLHAIENLRIQDVVTPNPSEKEILIKVEACTIKLKEFAKLMRIPIVICA